MAKKDKRRKSTVAKQERNRQKKQLYQSRMDGPAFYSSSQSETPEQRVERLARLGVDITRVDVQQAPRRPVAEQKRVAQVPQSSFNKLPLAEQIEKTHHALSHARAQVIPLPKGVENRLLPVGKVGIFEKDDQTDVARNDMVKRYREQCAYVSRLEKELEALGEQYEREVAERHRQSRHQSTVTTKGPTRKTSGEDFGRREIREAQKAFRSKDEGFGWW